MKLVTEVGDGIVVCLRFVLCDVLGFIALIYCILATLESRILEYNTFVSQIYFSSLFVDIVRFICCFIQAWTMEMACGFVDLVLLLCFSDACITCVNSHEFSDAGITCVNSHEYFVKSFYVYYFL